MKSKIIRILTIFSLALTLSLSTSQPVNAQCPMCRMSAEQNLKDGGQAGKGLNAGILYMLATPYLLVGGLAYFWWRNRRREDGEAEEVDVIQ